ncbi:TIM21-domain-containing protein [Fomitopsis serialis]|uniref:TIM21-domain-containing protein n=1 Tax=Fomitopsis serialis TaxID=139415 RepID=UPI002007A740|nr:TIM21-domain-containing protein [Neoantrodia serialis]KAH9937430.1 TIM21-domain-containing protein [Neoantrodia serialis]
MLPVKVERLVNRALSNHVLPRSVKTRPTQLRITLCRSYATHNDRVPASSLLSSALEQNQRQTRGEDYVGPFQLGLIPPTPRGGGNTKKWSELSTAGKVARTTARTTNLAVILVGAGLSAVLIYALTSELFSKNSATVLYGQACDKIKASPALARHLQGSLIFHNNPPSSLRPRHRNHHVSSQVVVDSTGREHMLLHFYVQARPPGSKAFENGSEDVSYADKASAWVKRTASSLSDLTTDELAEKSKARAQAAMDSTKELFHFLSGDPLPRSQPEQSAKEEVRQEKEEKGWTSGVTGLFSGLRGTTKSSPESRDSTDASAYSEGEVHADLILNDDGYYKFRYLFVDIPNSRSWSSKRIFVEQAAGVRDNEPIMSWSS